jgi:hypothetical protein
MANGAEGAIKFLLGRQSLVYSLYWGIVSSHRGHSFKHRKQIHRTPHPMHLLTTHHTAPDCPLIQTSPTSPLQPPNSFTALALLSSTSFLFTLTLSASAA